MASHGRGAPRAVDAMTAEVWRRLLSDDSYRALLRAAGSAEYERQLAIRRGAGASPMAPLDRRAARFAAAILARENAALASVTP